MTLFQNTYKNGISKNRCGVYWTKFECISDKIRRILTNDTCLPTEALAQAGASAALDKLARGKTQKFPTIFICGSPHTPRREAENLKGRKFLVLLRRFSLQKEQSYFNILFALFSTLTATEALPLRVLW